MQWMALSILTTTMGAEAVTGMLMDMGINGAMIEDRADVFVSQMPEGQWDIMGKSAADSMGEGVKVTAYIPLGESADETAGAIRLKLENFKRMNLGFDPGELTMKMNIVDEEDWASNWKVYFQPLRLGKNIVIKPTWREYDALPGDSVVEIDPGMAFGTGTHETTAMLVDLIEQFVKPGDHVADIGTGSGILALCAAKMGAESVIAADNDPVALRVTSENARLNRLEGRVKVMESDLLTSINGKYDVIIANIITDVIIYMAGQVSDKLKPHGVFMASGITKARFHEARGALKEAGLYISAESSRGEWSALAAQRLSPAQ
jgi:ribosomal protein L11 methyltransferase